MKWLDHWAEAAGFFLLIIGVILSFFLNIAMSFITVFLCGIIIGRLYCMKRDRRHASFYVVSIGFIIGYLIGSLFKGYSQMVLFFILLFFIFGWWAGNKITINRLWK